MINILKKRGYKTRVMLLVIADIVACNMCTLIALLIRFDFKYGSINQIYVAHAMDYSVINTATVLTVIFGCKLYNSIWSYAGVNELCMMLKAVVINFVLQVAGMHYIFGKEQPRSYYVLYGVLLMVSLMATRFSYRFLRLVRARRFAAPIRVMIVGAGEAGMVLSKEIQSSTKINKKVVCFIDDNLNKKGRFLQGIEIVGDRNVIPKMVEKYKVDEIYIAMPSVPKVKQRAIMNICYKTGRKVKTLPGIYQLVNGEVSFSRLKEVEIEDLLGRDTIDVNMDEIKVAIEGKTVLVTGGGGSIGSELCRQIASYNPKELIILDIYENNAYDIQQELKARYKDQLNLTVLIGSVRNTHRIETVFEKYRPQIVFHAAAHKHVPLMEDSPCEAIKNNVFGTYKTAVAAKKYNAEKFVLISTDKAVNPTNIMGASKRICEMIVQMFAADNCATDYVAVRFGNVLGSNGSVIPLFKKQIAAGGPVTVTDKNIIRYFMTIPEAVSLVLQAGAFAKGGEIFVLDMGEPVKIDDLARNLIKLSGFEPDVDIKINYIGLRPGEKLYEELLMNEEGLRETSNNLIHIGKPIEFDYEMFNTKLAELKKACEADENDIKKLVKEMVPTYVPEAN